MSDWRPIETAPKDGTEIDVWAAYTDEAGGKRVTDVAWGESWRINDIHGPQQWGWVDPNGGYDGCAALIDPEVYEITHWMPVPKGPV